MGREDEIKSLAYSLWEQEGHQEGHDYEYWLRAEAMWIEQNQETTGKTSSAKSKTGKQKTKVTSSVKR